MNFVDTHGILNRWKIVSVLYWMHIGLMMLGVLKYTQPNH